MFRKVSPENTETRQMATSRDQKFNLPAAFRLTSNCGPSMSVGLKLDDVFPNGSEIPRDEFYQKFEAQFKAGRLTQDLFAQMSVNCWEAVR